MKHFILPLLLVSFLFVSASARADGVFRLGIIGTDTSHVPAFVKLFNDPNAEGDYQKFQVVGAYKGGMPDNESSWSRKDGYANDIAPLGVKVYDTIEEMLANVDGVRSRAWTGVRIWNSPSRSSRRASRSSSTSRWRGTFGK